MRISIFGLGYVGSVSGACLARMGHSVIGVDLNPDKVAMLNAGQCPVVEERIGELTEEMVASGRLSATTDTAEAVRATDVSLISVGTPSAPDGSPELSAVDAVTRAIGEIVGREDKEHTLIVRSTVPPGACVGRLKPILEAAAGRAVGDRLHLVFNPEFLREGSSVRDFESPPFTIVGSLSEGGFAAAEQLYDGVDAPLIRADIGVAESIKVLSNAYHALKIAFANEAGALLKSAGIDARQAMEVFCRDTQLNISRAYLRPGFAFGGSCLPKELRGLSALGRSHNVSMALIDAVLESNRHHIDRVVDRVLARGRGRVALFGIAFKPGTDDLRESPLVALAERLIGKGYELSIVDHFVETSRLLGRNKAFIEKEMPHFESLLTTDAKAALDGAKFVIVGHASKDDIATIASSHAGKTILDLQGVAALENIDGADYEGVCW